MINSMTNKPLYVESGDGVYPSIDLPVSQLEEVKHRLDRAGLEYWQMGNFKWEDEPWVTTLVFFPKFDPQKIQEVLDSEFASG